MTGRDVLRLISRATTVEDAKCLLAFGLGCCGMSIRSVRLVLSAGSDKRAREMASRGLRLLMALRPEPGPDPDDQAEIPEPPAG